MLSPVGLASLSIAFLLFLNALECIAKGVNDQEESFESETSYTRVKTPELKGKKGRRDKQGLKRPMDADEIRVKPQNEFHFPYRPKYPAHRLLGHCRIEDFDFNEKNPLGEGGFGQVFRATHNSGMSVALKKISAKSIKEKPKHVEHEETIQRILAHPNIGQLLCTMRNDQYDIFFVLEYFESGNLVKNLRFHPLPRTLKAKYVAQIILALRYLHEQCIMYRDLKAENIMLGQNDDIKLIDFGLSVYSCERDQTSLAGTLEYVAPEVARRSNYGREADYYSLGVLVFLLQTKRLPYTRKTLNLTKDEFTKQIAKGILKIPPTGDKDVDQLISLLTLPDQEERWKTVHDGFEKIIKELSYFSGVDWTQLEEMRDYMF